MKLDDLEKEVKELKKKVELLEEKEELLKRLKEIEKSMPVITLPAFQYPSCYFGHDFPSPWYGIGPATCRRCGAPSYTYTTITCGSDSAGQITTSGNISVSR